jgi:transcriptional regulator with XRE-family HTH domain
MNVRAGSSWSAGEVGYFRDPESGVDVEAELDELSAQQLEALARIVVRLSMYPDSRNDVRTGDRWAPVLPITFNGTLWVLYWVRTRHQGSPAAGSLYVRILVIGVLETPSTEVPQPLLALAVERYARDIEMARTQRIGYLAHNKLVMLDSGAMSELDPHAEAGEAQPRALRAIVERFDGGESEFLKALANRRVLAQLSRERVRSGKTQAEIAKAIDRPASDISRFERGENDPRLSKVVCIADALSGHLAFVPGRLTTLLDLADLDEEWDRPETTGVDSEPAEGRALCIVLRGDISEDSRRIADAVAKAVVAAVKPLGGSLKLEAVFPLEPGDAPWESPLERAIAEADSEDAAAVVREHLGRTEILALGSPAGTVSRDGMTGTESDLLHFTVDDDGRDIVLLPVFTRPGFMREPLLQNPSWQRLSVLELNGGSLLANLDADVRIVINPWSALEFQLLSRDDSEVTAPVPAIVAAFPDIDSPLNVGSSSRSVRPARELAGARLVGETVSRQRWAAAGVNAPRRTLRNFGL